MKRQVLISLVVLLSIETSALSAVRLVPTRDYPTIQSAINKAVNGDVVVVAPGIYTGPNNVDLDFKGKAITVKSQINPANPDWNIIAATVIDCGGNRYTPRRAFWFHTSEGPNSKVQGFTIRNGYSRGLQGANGIFGVLTPVPYQSVDPADPNGPPRALSGQSASGNGYGGAILCGDSSSPIVFASPTIQYCVITSCIVTGAQGGDGAAGQSGTWNYQPPDPNAALGNTPDGQWAGDGGNGSGNGYGGAIACLGGSNPLISGCIIKDNFAHGGSGGDGGSGGNAASPPNYNQGLGSFGGNGGIGIGDGIGGGIYCENASAPTIVNCSFSNNIAMTGIRAAGGLAGQGNAIPAADGGPATDGFDGFVISTGGIAGGAAYYSHPSTANFTNCTFTGNKAYEAYIFYDPLYAYILGEDISAYTVGGAVYSDVSNSVTINTCDFINNMGGAVYCGSSCTVSINNTYDPNHKCLFLSNSDPNDGSDLYVDTGIDFGSGGAIYLGPGTIANIQNCIFSSNLAKNDGGALKCETNITLNKCSFSGNTAKNGWGGATDVYRSQAPAPLTIDANNCSFSRNQALFGGGFSSENFTAVFANCYFIGNTAVESGGLDLVNGNISVNNSIIKDNIATDGDGGGLNCYSTKAEILHSTIMDNLAGGCGGAINFEGQASLHRVFNCFITGNSAIVDGGAIYCYSATPQIQNCTFDDDFSGGFGGAIFSNWGSLPQITNCIFRGCNGHAIHEEDNGGNASATYCLFYNNPGGEYYDSGTRLVYTGAGQVGSIPGGSNNLYGDPLFVSGDLGGYYLRQSPPQTLPNSPAINNGSGTAVSLGLNTYTTRTDNVGDAGLVDRGYHYRRSADVKTFHLTASVIGGHGTVAPTSGTYYAGTVVTLTATPNIGWMVKAWTGTDNDLSTDVNNNVVMYTDRTVTVEFRQPRTLIVSVGGGQQGYYSDIQDAVLDANDGDTVVVYPGIYYGAYIGQVLAVDRSVLITSRNPDDPCCVAATIIDGLLGTNAYTNSGVMFTSNTGAGTVLNGFTIRNCGGNVGNSINGNRNLGHPNGYDGGPIEGPAIFVESGGGPTIKNCVIRDNWIRGGYGGDGENATTTQNAGRGGWSGWARGGAVYCAAYSSPTFINCQIIDNQAFGGNGGNGGNYVTPGGQGNYGGTWSRAGSPGSLAYDINPLNLNMTPIIDGTHLWELWQWDYAALYWPMYGDANMTSYFGDYRWYSGYGGGAYCDIGSNVTFIDCLISGNLAQGGMSGQGGTMSAGGRPWEPLIPYEIPSFGGGVYCAADAAVTFTGCVITDNISSPPVLVDPADPNSGLRFRLDPYLGHGGGVCAEDTATVVFNNCGFSRNEASVGGGLNWANANPVISDCNFISNSAYHGGGLFGEHGPATIIGCNITNNEAVTDPNLGEETLGAGGGVHCWATDVNVIDCNISSNRAEYSGGGVYFGGENAQSLFNCLIADNSAGRDGGGVSIDWYSDSNIVNCTIADNSSWGYGGGVYCSYNSYVNIIDSIIWDNIGIYGTQLAVATGYTYDPRPSTVNVSYSDVGVRDVIYDLIDANGLPTIRPGFDTNSLAANDDLSTGLVDIGFDIDFFGRTSSQLYVNNNGNVTFDANMMTFTPFGLTGNIGTSIIAPFFADVDTRPGAIPTNALTRYGTGMVDGRPAFGVTWIDVGYFSMHWNKLNSFQLVLIDRSDRGPGDFDIEFNYGKIQWETGDASGGVNGLGSFSARAGFSNGTGNPGTFYEFEGSGVPGAFLDSRPTGLIHGSRRSAVNGRYIFAVQSGLPELLPTVPIYVGVNCILDGWDWNSGINNWEPNFTDYHNINEDPLFIAGYLLSQFDANQPVESNCVDGGSVPASKVGLDKYTTRIDSVPDAGIVDMGYHYNLFTVPQYKLTINAVGVTVIEPVVYPPDYSRLYNWYTTVHLRIDSSTYNPNDYQVQWSGTDDDSLTGPNNTVTMDGNKLVTVRLVKTRYNLTIGVNGGNGRLSARWVEGSSSYTINDPCTHSVKFGAVVQLTAVPDEGYRVRRWSGTDNDSSRAPASAVTMNSDRTVSVEFGPPVTVTVPGDYPTIWDAVSEVEAGDTIVVEPGTYYGGYGAVMVVVDKPVVIMSRNPDDPCCVAQTILDGYMGYPLGQGYNNIGVVFTTAADANTVLNGFTIQNCGGYVGDSLDGGRDVNHPDGYDGGCWEGAAIIIMPGASPTIKNCVIRNNVVQAGNAGNGENATATANAGRGGWGGWARGGAVYCGPDSRPAFINCQIIDNQAQGGNGGNGGDYVANGGAGNYGGNWSINRGDNIPSTGLGTVYVDGDLWEVWQWDQALSYWPLYGEPMRTSYFGDYRWYSGYGGGVYCDVNSTVDFNDCIISGNTAQGGMSGQGGVMGPGGRQQEPLVPYEIPSYGGGVYCAAGASITFTGCTITNNISSPPQYVVAGNPASGLRNRLDPYVGHGGGVCAENTASVVFTGCTFSGNEASLGAGTFWADANSSIIDSNVVDNLAFNGGGIYLAHGSSEIVGSYFSGNDANGPVGAGGAVYCSDANVLITDCNMAHNDANSSGGGLYFTGSNTMSVKNCLIINNLAGRDGGGVSANWYANAVLANCTLAGNAAPGTYGEPGNTGLGGGLYASYESNTSVIDSIFWNNYALKGSEMGVGTGFEHDPRPAKLTVSYSDVRGGQFGVRVDTGCVLNWGAGNRDSDPLFVTGMFGDYYLSQTAVGDPNQTQNSPCVDAGSDYTGNVGMIRHVDPTGRIVAYTTRTDGELDHGKVDMGYHYRTVEPCRFCDLHYDGIINFLDDAVVDAHWLESGCSDLNGWCGGADLTFDGIVDFEDKAFLVAECWLVEDTKAPIPNPSEWEIEPYLTSSSSIKMIAQTAFDEWGWDVEYYFDCVYGNCHDRSWQQSRTYQDTGLNTDARYGYRVRARDELGNETEWSVIRYAGVLDTIPPAPAPTWAVAPYAVGSASIAMEATVAYDDSGVSYGFWNVTNDPAGNNIVWQPGLQFIDVNLDPNTTYGYRVKARDGSANQNETAWSVMAYATTLGAVDVTPPTPNPAQWDLVVDANGYNGRPRKVNIGGGPSDYYATMRAVQATDPPDNSGVEYRFVCDDSRYSSGWQNQPAFATPWTYQVQIGGVYVYTEWYVIVRDQSPNRNQTAPSETWPALVRNPP